MKKAINSARGNVVKGRAALVKVQALIAADLVGPLLIENPQFLKMLAYDPDAFEIAKRPRIRYPRALH